MPVSVLHPLLTNPETGKAGGVLVLSEGLEPPTYGLENHRSGPTEL